MRAYRQVVRKKYQLIIWYFFRWYFDCWHFVRTLTPKGLWIAKWLGQQAKMSSQPGQAVAGPSWLWLIFVFVNIMGGGRRWTGRLWKLVEKMYQAIETDWVFHNWRPPQYNWRDLKIYQHYDMYNDLCSTKHRRPLCALKHRWEWEHCNFFWCRCGRAVKISNSVITRRALGNF